MTILNRQCRRCGCTDSNACIIDGVPCHWVSLDPPICSACADLLAEQDVTRDAADCPASATGFHQALFRADNSAYCVHCKSELGAQEAA
jgi:hypothetical protein